MWKSIPQGQARRDNASLPPRPCVSLWIHFTNVYQATMYTRHFDMGRSMEDLDFLFVSLHFLISQQ